MISFVAYTIYTDFITKNDFSSEMTIAIVGLLFLSVIIIALMWGFYQLIYGFLLKKLKRNYEELQKIDL
jgi:predicted permease